MWAWMSPWVPSSSLGVNVTIGLVGLFGFRLLTRGEVGGLRWPLPGVGRTLAGREFDETRALHAACILPHSSSNEAITFLQSQHELRVQFPSHLCKTQVQRQVRTLKVF